MFQLGENISFRGKGIVLFHSLWFEFGLNLVLLFSYMSIGCRMTTFINIVIVLNCCCICNTETISELSKAQGLFPYARFRVLGSCISLLFPIGSFIPILSSHRKALSLKTAMHCGGNFIANLCLKKLCKFYTMIGNCVIIYPKLLLQIGIKINQSTASTSIWPDVAIMVLCCYWCWR